MMPHSQNKSIFDAECGAPNPLITLANNYGQSITSRGNTGAETYLRQLVPGGSGTGELLAEEYLARVAKQTPLPESFNTELLLRSVQAGPLSNLSLYEALWHGALRPEPAISLGEVWANQLSSRQSPAINDVWAAEYLSRASDDVKHLPSASNLADEYLDRFKDMQVEDSRFAREWADDFLHTKASARSNFDQFEEEWRNIQREQERYRFSAVNPYKEEGEGKVRQDLLESARRELAAGNISNGILQLEAHLHDSPQDSEAWCELGLCHAENEQDAQAIRAFRSCLKTSAPTNRKALLALSVSLANEGLEGAALLELEKWIHALADPQTKEFPMKDMLDGTVIDNGQFKEVEGRFESRLAVLGPMDAPEKAELLSAFGVLYNLNRAYDRAVDCIQQALQIRPEDAVLWNRLGATLANSEQSVEAIGAYRQALHLFPTYVRARYNLGICCMNLRSYRDAVGHFLTAIQLQSSNNSEIWVLPLSREKLRDCIPLFQSQLRSACIRLTDDPNVPFLDMMQALNSRDLTRLLSLFPVEQLVT